MSEIILSSGAYHQYVSGSSIGKTVIKHGGYSLTKAVLDILAANTCCTKNIVADSLTLLNKGKVTQTGSPTNDVSLNAPLGVITTASLSNATNTCISFRVYNSYVTENSVVNITPWYTSVGIMVATLVGVGNGYFNVQLCNASDSDAFDSIAKIHFTVF